jgi:hypothetical protein
MNLNLPLSEILIGVLHRIEDGTKACYALAPAKDPTQTIFKAVIHNGLINLPYNFSLISGSLSNHATLQFGERQSSLKSALAELARIIEQYLQMPDGQYRPRIEIEWALSKRSATYRVWIDEIALSTKLIARKRCAEDLALALQRHARLYLAGPANVYRMVNFPTHGRIQVTLRAPTEALAIARIGALVGQGLEQMHGARGLPMCVMRVNAEKRMLDDAKAALEAIDLPPPEAEVA